jgi:hypothetical protein
MPAMRAGLLPALASILRAAGEIRPSEIPA